MIIFSLAASAYLISLIFFQILVPRLGARTVTPAVPHAI
jgi:hypothetical protein